MKMVTQYLFDGIEDLPQEMLKSFAFRDPIDAAGAWVLIPIILWLGILVGPHLVPIFRQFERVWRGRDGMSANFGTIFFCAAIYMGSWASYLHGGKENGDTNPPPAAVSESIKRINLYYQDATGHLIPLGAKIERANP
jgi:hypothetical protein